VSPAQISSARGYGGISLAGRWECGGCGAQGDGWWNEEDGLVLHDEDEQQMAVEDHVCEEN
jgi:hypothetical protein